MLVAWRWLALISLSTACGRIGFDSVDGIGEPRSCRDAKLLKLPTGVYTFDPDRDGRLAARDVWCEQDLRGGGWTLALAVDGTQPTFLGANSIWVSTSLLNPTSLDPMGGSEAKLAPYLDEPLAELMMVIDGGGEAVMRVRGTSLHALIASGLTFPTTTPEDEFRAAFPPGVVQEGCRRQGVGLTNQPTPGDPHQLRIGFIANNEAEECTTSDSFMGVGAELRCSNSANFSAGNVNAYQGAVDTCAPRRVLVFVRDDDQTRFASEPSCAAHLARGRTEDGVYLVGAVPRRCDMTTDGGGWTNALDFDGVRDPCPPPWVADPTAAGACMAPVTEEIAGFTIASPVPAYREVMAQATGYQRASSDAFRNKATIDGTYVDGLSITTGSPRQHLATFASGYNDLDGCGGPISFCNCPCLGGPPAPPFIAAGGYRCEAGALATPNDNMAMRPDPLFDGAEVSAQCAAEASIEPIRTTLAEPTSEPLEARLLRNEPIMGEGLSVYRLALWVR